MNRQASRARLNSRTVMPIDLWSWMGPAWSSLGRVLKYQASPMLVRISAAISQCRLMATAL